MSTKAAARTEVDTAFRQEWLDTVTALQNQVKAWADKEPGWAFTAQEERKIKETVLGEYSVTVWKLQTPDGEVRLEPIARNYPGRGIVELYAWPTLYRVRLIRDEEWGGVARPHRLRHLSQAGMEPRELHYPHERSFDRRRMSDVYIQRLRGVQMEFNAARESIRYVQRNWQRYDIYADLPSLKPVHFEEAGRSVEVTYFVRLYAEFEGILKDHPATNHPAVVAPDKPKVDKLISLVTKLEGFKVDPALRRKMEAVRDYRNSVAHRVRAAAPSVTFVDALSSLNKFLAKLPEPLT